MLAGGAFQRIRALERARARNPHLPSVIRLRSDDRYPPIPRPIRQRVLNDGLNLRSHHRHAPRVMHLHRNRHTESLRHCLRIYTHRVRLSERREPMKFKSLLLVLMFTLTSATWPQAAPSQAPASASSPTPSAQHQKMMEMHKQQMEAMKADVEKMKSSLAQMKANLLTIKDTNEMARWRNNVDMWEVMVGHMDRMLKHMESMGPA